MKDFTSPTRAVLVASDYEQDGERVGNFAPTLSEELGIDIEPIDIQDDGYEKCRDVWLKDNKLTSYRPTYAKSQEEVARQLDNAKPTKLFEN